MEYIPGIIHESLQQIRAIQINSGSDNAGIHGDFTRKHTDVNDVFYFLTLREGIRYGDCDVRIWPAADETQMESVPLRGGDIILIKYFRTKTSPDMVFLVSKNGEPINRESIISKEFIDVNLTDRKINGIFTDITRQFIRDERLNQII